MAPQDVIPAQAGIQGNVLRALCVWTPAFAGVTAFVVTETLDPGLRWGERKFVPARFTRSRFTRFLLHFSQGLCASRVFSGRACSVLAAQKTVT